MTFSDLIGLIGLIVAVFAGWPRLRHVYREVFPGRPRPDMPGSVLELRPGPYPIRRAVPEFVDVNGRIMRVYSNPKSKRRRRRRSPQCCLGWQWDRRDHFLRLLPIPEGHIRRPFG